MWTLCEAVFGDKTYICNGKELEKTNLFVSKIKNCFFSRHEDTYTYIVSYKRTYQEKFEMCLIKCFIDNFLGCRIQYKR